MLFIFGKVQAIWTGAPPTERDRAHAITGICRPLLARGFRSGAR